jgi:hypothetical protein
LSSNRTQTGQRDSALQATSRKTHLGGSETGFDFPTWMGLIEHRLTSDSISFGIEFHCVWLVKVQHPASPNCGSEISPPKHAYKTWEYLRERVSCEEVRIEKHPLIFLGPTSPRCNHCDERTEGSKEGQRGFTTGADSRHDQRSNFILLERSSILPR